MGSLSRLWKGLRTAAFWLVRAGVQRPAMLFLAVVVVVLGGATWFASTLLQRYLEDLHRNREWVEHLEIGRQDRMLRVVFERALEAELIWSTMTADGVRLHHVSCENRRDNLGPEGVGERGDKAQQSQQALSLLCTTDHGAQIREEIRQWNDSEWLIAVRDDRRKQPATPGRRVALACDEAPQRLLRAGETPRPRTAFATVPRRCLLNRWRMFTLAGDREIAIDSRTFEPSPTEYDFIASDGPRYMSDWASLTPIANLGPLREFDYRLRSDVTLPADGLVRIDLVGIARRVAAGGAQLDLVQTPPSARGPAVATGADRTTIGVRARCNARSVQGDCARLIGAAKPVPYAYTIEIRGRPGQMIPVSIDVRMQRNLPRELVDNLAEAQDSATAPAPVDEEDLEEETDEGWIVSQRTLNLVVRCPDNAESGGSTPCELSWRQPPEEVPENDESVEAAESKSAKDQAGMPAGKGGDRTKAPSRTKAPFSVTMAADKQRTNLVDQATGEFTAETLDLGLAPVVGGGVSQWGSLARAIRSSPTSGGSATLSIDPDAQRIVTSVLEARRTVCGPSGPRDCLFRHPGARATIVLMDATKERAGEIKAMVSWPPGRTGSHVWDLAAGGGGAWRASATSPAAWRLGGDGYSQPGSTFKVMTALAAIEATLEGKTKDAAQIGQLLRGEMNPTENARFLGLRTRVPVPKERRSRECAAREGSATASVDMLYVQRRSPARYACLQNFENRPNETHFVPLAASRCPRGRPPADARQLGLCEALMKSSNLFFGGLALKMDLPKVVEPTGERTTEIKDLALSKIANRLTPVLDKPYDLMRGGLTKKAPLLFLDQQPLIIENTRKDPSAAGAPKPDRKVMAATSGYGQNVYAAPLTIASIYASLGAGQIARPRLLPRDVEGQPQPDPEEGAALLRAGSTADQDAYLKLLRAGLHAVVAAPGGSAYDVFRAGRARGARTAPAPLASLVVNGGEARLFGKTGTATINKRYNTVWFAGWIEARPGGIPRRLAFVCQAIQQPAGQKLTGGSVCAPIMRDILLRLDQQTR
jgi:cell division protein FtsI/penicillin-binding protein 2